MNKTVFVHLIKQQNIKIRIRKINKILDDA